MRVPLTVLDYLDRAELLYGDRVGVIDEPDQPAAVVGRGHVRAAWPSSPGPRPRGSTRSASRHGERVAIVTQNAARLLTAFFGVSGYGRVLVPINFRLNEAEVGYIVEHSGATVFLVDPELADLYANVPAKRTFVIGDATDAELHRFGVEPEAWARDEDATATINYTSGTTARPEGCAAHAPQPLAQRGDVRLADGRRRSRRLPAHAADVPLQRVGHDLRGHGHGWSSCRAAQDRRRGDPAARRRARHHAHVRRARGRRRGARRGRGVGRADSRRWPCAHRRRRRAAADAHDRARRDRAGLGVQPDLRAHRDVTVAHDESRPRRVRATCRPAERARKLGRAGAPALGVQVRIDEHGEVLARSNVVLEGYWEQPEATADAIVDGWFHTGDGGTIDDEGYLTISDRKKDVIISGGENVSSIEVEDALCSHPEVAEAAVIGVPDEKWGETVKALVVLVQGGTVTEIELIEHCRGSLAHYKCPTSVEYRDELARTATGKLQKFKLRAPYWEGRTRTVN